jgi:hypothetical protein
MEYKDLFERLKMEIYRVPTSGITRQTLETHRQLKGIPIATRML